MAEAAEDLRTWTEVEEVETEGKSPAAFRDAVPINAESRRRRFLRLKISREGKKVRFFRPRFNDKPMGN